ncbi:MAG: YbaN family protein [Spirochaetia bacterium]|jgi:uncharacterized membrane protein YbaN (DUF454 family)|nr:YbaN family protein [Spirochaetia bacterium]
MMEEGVDAMEDSTGLETTKAGLAMAEALDNAGSRIRRVLLIAAGTLFVTLGLVGVVLPVLPTTPFLLLAAACYVRSSRRLYRWLLANRLFGEYIRRFRDGEGIPLSTKIWAICLLWLSLGSSALLAVPARLWWVRLILLVVGIGVTNHIARIPTRRIPEEATHYPDATTWQAINHDKSRSVR